MLRIAGLVIMLLCFLCILSVCWFADLPFRGFSVTTAPAGAFPESTLLLAPADTVVATYLAP